MDDKTQIENLRKAVELLLPHAESWRYQLEVDARTKHTVSISAEAVRKQIEQARKLAGTLT